MQNDSAPKTIEEVGIHLFYMNEQIRDLTQLVKDQTSHYATKEEVIVLSKQADGTHLEINNEIVALQKRATQLERRISTYGLIEKVIFTILGAVGMSVLAAILGLVIKTYTT